ncbi:Helix-turn-helix domain protein [Pseudovibrio sp. Ad46]|uniref:ArsR/SmtB family transcription factor n=1 Tax=unclassified Pseudovibrio TaxID=2627060 RepID=UPI0007AE50A5|nr:MULTISPECIES: metalloregulator ArsR/SmtB family transcription factor [unclassified Pseudovibrio]KZK77067.1 Helix-turn-helix domain protein [Pseudovibrio sp. Ad46]KZL14759.1 Helix-turn-helix domain protein [Pseudovibrio sp. Ad37]
MTENSECNTSANLKEDEAVAALSALAHKDRLAAFRLILTAMPKGLPSGQIAKDLSIAPTRMSFHLATLERAGLLTAQREGRVVRYAIAPHTMRGLLRFLTQDCCSGDPTLCLDFNPFPCR